MFARVVTDEVPGIQAGQHRTGTGDHEGNAPGAQCSDQPRDDHCAQCCAKRCSAVEQGSAAAAFILRHPDRIQLSPGRINRRFRCTQAQACQQQTGGAVGQTGDSLTGAPENCGRGNDDTRLEAVGHHAAWHLHQRIGPEERTKDQALHSRIQVEVSGDQWHRHRYRRAVNVVDCDQRQQYPENFPSDARLRLGCYCFSRFNHRLTYCLKCAQS